MPFHVLAVSFYVWMISKQNVYLVNSKQISYIYIYWNTKYDNKFNFNLKDS